MYWQHLLDAGVVADTAEIAEREGLHKTFISDHLRLAMLAPDLLGLALRGKLPRTVTLLGLLRSGIEPAWKDQRAKTYSSGQE